MLYILICRVWSSTDIPLSWQQAVITLIPKSDDLGDPSKFRPIALSNCYGKLFFSLLSNRLTGYLLANNFLSTDTQKGFLPKTHGCVEHTYLSTSALKDARSSSRSICISWIDLKNAFGLVRHSLIQFALDRYHLPFSFNVLIYNYYNNLLARIVTKTFTSKPFHYSIGIFFKVVPSLPFFLIIVFQLLLDLINQPKYQPLAYSFKHVNISLLSAAYADDLEVVTSCPEYNQKLLQIVDLFLTWSVTMKTNPAKSYVLALKRFDNRYRNGPYTPLTNESYTYF